MIKQIFVNLPVNNLAETIDFFTKLGFTFDPRFTDENATSMIVNENIFVMFLVKPFFLSFTKKDIADTSNTVEVLNAVSVESRDEVDEMVNKAIAAGGKEPRAAQDHGWMYGRAFEDINGHTWEFFYMDMSQMPKEMEAKK